MKFFASIIKATLIIIFLSLAFTSTAQSTLQELMNSRDLSNFKVEMLKDEDIIKYKAYLQNAGITETQAEQMALQRGMPSSEILKLKARVASLSSRTTTTTKPTTKGRTNTSRDIDSLDVEGSRVVEKEKEETQR